jgi:hypothetical protein
MSALKQACARLVAFFRREALDREFDEEAQSHLDLTAEDYVRRGTPEAEARRLARITFGAVGRDFVPAGEVPGAAPVAILSYSTRRRPCPTGEAVRS